jgi:hypothetical protein
MKKIFAIVLLFAGAMTVTAQATKIDVTGTWTLNVESAAGASSPSVTLKQEGEKLTGHYSSQLVGEAPVTGTVKGQNIEFSVSVDVQGTKLVLRYAGTVEGSNSMKGTLSLGELGDGTFTAKRN